MGTTYIDPNSEKLPDPHFLSGVSKIQERKFTSLTDAEKEACAHLKKAEAEAPPGDDVDNDANRIPLSMQERIKRRKQETSDNNEDIYMNVDSICGSAAEVERLWSIAKYILTDQRKSMTPQMFEALLFLKINERFWDLALVQKAMHMTVTQRVAKNIADDLANLGFAES